MKSAVKMLHCIAFYVVTPGSAVISRVQQYIFITNIIFVLIPFSSETPSLYSEIGIGLSRDILMCLAAI